MQLIQNKVEKITNLQLIALYRLDKYIFTFYKIILMIVLMRMVVKIDNVSC